MCVFLCVCVVFVGGVLAFFVIEKQNETYKKKNEIRTVINTIHRLFQNSYKINCMPELYQKIFLNFFAWQPHLQCNTCNTHNHNSYHPQQQPPQQQHQPPSENITCHNNYQIDLCIICEPVLAQTHNNKKKENTNNLNNNSNINDNLNKKKKD